MTVQDVSLDKEDKADNGMVQEEEKTDRGTEVQVDGLAEDKQHEGIKSEVVREGKQGLTEMKLKEELLVSMQDMDEKSDRVHDAGYEQEEWPNSQ